MTRGLRNQRAIDYIEVPRSTYWFGHRAYHDTGAGNAPESEERPYLVERDALGSGPIYGLAIADASEVRGVRVATFGGSEKQPGRHYRGPWLELIEGCPLRVEAGEDPRMMLDRLDFTDGRLVLAVARAPEAVELLPAGPCAVRANAHLVIDAEQFANAVQVRLQAPRLAPSSEQMMQVTGFNAHGVTALNATLITSAVARALRPDLEALLTAAQSTTSAIFTASTVVNEATNGADLHMQVGILQFDMLTPADFSARFTLGDFTI